MPADQQVQMEAPKEEWFKLAKAYAEGDNAAGAELVGSVDESSVASLPHMVRAILMDAIMEGKDSALDERSAKLLQAALTATTDSGYLLLRGQEYLASNHLMAAETLLEWRVVLCAQTKQGSVEHIEALIDLAEVYQIGGKGDQCRDLRSAAIATCERRGQSEKQASSQLLIRVANACFDASDLGQADYAAKQALSLLEACNGPSDQQVTCLRLMHTLAQRLNKPKEAQQFAKRILRLQGDTQSIDEIERALTTYIRLPEQLDLRLRPEGIDLTTDDFPRVIAECCGLDLQQYFVDAFAQYTLLTADEKAKLAAQLFHVFRTITSFVTGPEGAKLTRTEVTRVELPAAISQGFIQAMTMDTTVTFRMVPNPPDEATFVNVSGITFDVGGKLVGVSQINFKAEGDKCTITPMLDQRGQVKRSTSNALEALKNTGKDFLVTMFMATQKASMVIPIILGDYRKYLADAINFKSSLLYREKDLLSFFERCSSVEIDDPLTRSLLHGGSRIVKKEEAIQIERIRETICDLGGVALKIEPTLRLRLKKQQGELAIDDLTGINVKVPFDTPSDLKTIGLDLKRSLPQKLVNLKLGAADAHGRRRLVTGIGPNRWIGLDLDENMEPAGDERGNWMVFGVTSNPISGAPQSFFLRLDKNNELNMTTREIASLIDQTAMEGFDPSDPSTWQWGAVAMGAKTILVAGKILRSTIGDEETDKIAEDVKKIGKFFGKLFS